MLNVQIFLPESKNDSVQAKTWMIHILIRDEDLETGTIIFADSGVYYHLMLLEGWLKF